MQEVNIFWFRRDLSLTDNAGLYYALTANKPVLPLFVCDQNILEDLEDFKDKRVSFICDTIIHLRQQLINAGSALCILMGTPLVVFKKLTAEYRICAVYTNHDYEPYARKRDKEIEEFLISKNIAFHTYKNQVIFEKDDVLKSDGTPYTIFTPYNKAWKQKVDDIQLKPFPSEKNLGNLHKQEPKPMPSIGRIGFEIVKLNIPDISSYTSKIENYDKTRDYPYLDGTTHLGVHLRFGTISIRKLVAQAKQLNEIFLNELIWREFFQMILWQFPKVVSQSFKPEYDEISWHNNEKDFLAWQKGETGFPMVDAGMRQMNTTGFMHNRARMIAASFLTKLLLIDWRLGEAYFAAKLLDYELASNNGNWQWAAGSGCDAAPYFRIFNPETQMKKFDPHQLYIKKWIPEYGTKDYAQPIIDYKEARQRALLAYSEAVNKSRTK